LIQSTIASVKDGFSSVLKRSWGGEKPHLTVTVNPLQCK
jgi:hypothetical protein